METNLEGLGSAMVIFIIAALVIAIGAILLSGFQSNSSSSTSTPIQGDAVIVHQGGTYTAYTATANTNVSRGQALMNAVSNAVSGDSVYLSAETYNIIANTIDLSKGGTRTNIKLYGAGKFKTVIMSSCDGTVTQCAIIQPTSNSIVADMSILGTFPYNNTSGSPSFEAGWGSYENTGTYTNITLRNVYINTTNIGTDIIYINPVPGTSVNALIENVSGRSGWDTLAISAAGTANVFDSNFISTGIESTAQGGGLQGIYASGGKINVVNDVVIVSNTMGGGTGIGSEGVAAVVNVYKATVSYSGSGYTLSNSLGILTANAMNITYIPSAHNNGVIGSLTSYFGAYTYNKAPLPAPTTGGTGSSPAAISYGLSGLAEFVALLPLLALTIVSTILIAIITIALLDASKGDRY